MQIFQMDPRERSAEAATDVQAVFVRRLFATKQKTLATAATNILIIMIAALLVSCTPTNFELTSAETPACSGESLNQWNFVRNQSQGVMGHDPEGFYIAEYPAEKFGFLNINNWHPLSGYKDTLCGELHHFNVYDGSGDEMDWNNFVIPSAGFEYLISDALPFKGGSGTWCRDDNWHDCRGTDDCMEAELTPDQTFYENPWFPKSIGESVLEGREICTYGPWIRECVHGHRPEIHPAELTWWKENWGSADLYWLMAHQDDSNRFDDKNEFDIEGTAPAVWRPWAAAPMAASFKLAFEVNPAGPLIVYEIGEAFARNVVTNSHPETRRDADNGTQHAIEYNNKIVLRANENQPNDNDLGVTFTDICRRSNDTLQGYVNISTKTGVNNSGKEGYHVLFVTANEVGNVTDVVEIPNNELQIFIGTTGDPTSIRPDISNGHKTLLGDLTIGINSANDGKTDPDTQVERVEFVSEIERRELVYVQDSKGNGGRVKGVPLLGNGQLSFLMTSKDKINVTWPGLAFTAPIDETMLVSSDVPESAVRAMLKAVGGNFNVSTAALDVKRAAQMRLAAVPRVVMLKDGSASLEESSPFVEKLNGVLERADDSEIERIFGSTEPLRISWSFEANNLGTGETVPVITGQQASASNSESIQVIEISGHRYGEVVEIHFPENSEDIYEVRATIKVSDVFGSIRENERTVWSHFLMANKGAEVIDVFLPVLAAVADVPLEDLTISEELGILSPNDPELRNPIVRRSLIVRNNALQVAQDGRISFDELASLIRAARSSSE